MQAYVNTENQLEVFTPIMQGLIKLGVEGRPIIFCVFTAARRTRDNVYLYCNNILQLFRFRKKTSYLPKCRDLNAALKLNSWLTSAQLNFWIIFAIYQIISVHLCLQTLLRNNLMKFVTGI
jgi:hypothetical protein